MIFTREELLKAFLIKSGVPLSYISRKTGINRATLSLFLHGHKDLDVEKGERLVSFFDEYKKRWLD